MRVLVGYDGSDGGRDALELQEGRLSSPRRRSAIEMNVESPAFAATRRPRR